MRRRLSTERSLLPVLLVGFGLFIVLRVVEQAFWVLIMVLLALLLATALMPIVRFLQRIRLPPRGARLPRAAAALTVYLGSVVVLALAGYGIGAIFVGNLVGLVGVLPETAADLLLQLDALARSVGIPGLVPPPEQIAPEVQALVARAADAARLAAIAVGGLVDFFFRLFLVLTLAFFLVVEGDILTAFLVDLFPPSQREMVRQVSGRIGDRIGRWVLGQFVVAMISGALASLAALLLGIPYPVLIGIGTAIFDLAPAVGPGAMAIPVFFLGLAHSPLLAIAAAAIFAGLAMFDSHVVWPLITGRAVQLSTALIIIAAALGLALYGVIGALVSVPTAMALKVVSQEVLLPWLRERQRHAEN